MPRKSAASLALAGAATQLIHRPAPPADLTPMQKAYWVEVSNPLPADWWGDENKAVLAEYCRTLTTLAFINQRIDQAEAALVDVAEYVGLLNQREKFVRLQLSQATKMRLTQQAQYGHKQAHSEAKKPRSQGKPWEFE